jgi:hypothetical protein
MTTRKAHVDEIGTCTCSCSFAIGLRQSVHADMLEWANGHHEGMAEQISYFAEQLGTDQWEYGNLPWMDFPDFVSEHNWDDPAGVSHVARAVVELIRASGKPKGSSDAGIDFLADGERLVQRLRSEADSIEGDIRAIRSKAVAS